MSFDSVFPNSHKPAKRKGVSYKMKWEVLATLSILLALAAGSLLFTEYALLSYVFSFTSGCFAVRADLRRQGLA